MNFAMKKRFKYTDMLAFGDHRTAMIEYKYVRVGYEVELFQSFSEELYRELFWTSSSKSKFLLLNIEHSSPRDFLNCLRS